MMKENRKFTQWRLGRRRWHDKEWKEGKRKLRKELRKIKKGKMTREEYLEKKKEQKL